ncbi:MAG: diphthamide synthesis protein, partial [Nanoarchaeota archaeon]|nr:diphthamide synthesis protein [Nanoarchaeota archaeon]
DELKKIRKYLEKAGKTAIVGGQILGCDQTAALKLEDKADCFLYVGSGRFHPIGIAKKTGKDVWILHPEDMKLEKLNKRLVEDYEKRKRGQYTRFLHAKNIGVLITKKSGQSQVQATLENIFDLEKGYKDKKFYFFLTDTLDRSELENFPFIECWLNAMCPRIEEDIKVLNIEDLNEF